MWLLLHWRLLCAKANSKSRRVLGVKKQLPVARQEEDKTLHQQQWQEERQHLLELTRGLHLQSPDGRRQLRLYKEQLEARAVDVHQWRQVVNCFNLWHLVRRSEQAAY
jgi:hypothetical protein